MRNFVETIELQKLANEQYLKDIERIDANLAELGTPTDAEIATEMERLQEEYDNNEYQRLRQYPSIGDQLDALFKAGVFPADMAAQIQAVKDKYPKA